MKDLERLTFLKILALLSLVRWWSVFLIAAAQYLTSIFVLQPHESWKVILKDPFLHLVILSTSFIVSAGFIINSFYDQEKDMINRPAQTAFEHLLSRPTTLNLYLVFNLLGLVLASVISWRAVLFFAAFAFALWLYSHKKKHLPITGNVVKASLSFLPFFAIFFYYKIPHWGLVLYVLFLFTLELSRGLVKDVISLKGDAIFGYPSVPALKGNRGLSRHLFAIFLLSILLTIGNLNFELNVYLIAFIVLGLVIQLFSFLKLPKWLIQTQKVYWLHFIYKLIIVVGVVLLVCLGPKN